MKFYNLKFNANAPAAQQINVPTNTDYKLGVKVIQNGKELELSSSNVVLDNLSADEQKTNGYLTFTLSADDNAHIAQRLLSVDYTPLSAQEISIQKAQNIGVTTVLSAEAPDLIGKELTPKDYYVSYIKTDIDNAPTSADVEASYQSYRDYFNDKPSAQLIVFAGTTNYRLYATCKAVDDAARNGQLVVLDLPPKGVDYFLVRHNIDASTVVWKAVLSYTLKEDDQIQVPKISMSRPFVYRGVGLKIQLGTPLNTTFKLVENVFKSQCGDIATASGGGSGGDTTLSATTAYTNWVVSPSKWTTGSGYTYDLNAPQYGDFEVEDDPRHGWYWLNPDLIVVDLESDDPTETSLSVEWQDSVFYNSVEVYFNREAVVGYQLGDQSDKLLADRNVVKNLVAGVVESFGNWQVFTADGSQVNNGYVVWTPSNRTWNLYDGDQNLLGEASYGDESNNLIFAEGNTDTYAYRSHTFTCPNGVEIQAAPSMNGINTNIDSTNIRNMLMLGLFNHYGTNLYLDVE